MEIEELMRRLSGLVQMDVDAVHVYEEALHHVNDAVVRERFTFHQGEHESHVDTLSEWIAKLGGEPPEMRPDMLGVLADWFTAMRSMSGTHGAAKAIRAAEEYHNTRYAEAVGWDVGADLMSVLDSFRAQERQQLSWVNDYLAQGAAA